MMILRLLMVSLLCIFYCDAYRILGVFAINVKSHFLVFDRLMLHLAEKGHRIDIASFYSPSKKVPNYQHVIKFKGKQGNPTNNLTLNLVETIDVLEFVATIAGNELCEELGNPQILKLVRNPPIDPPYDLLITEVCCA